MTEQPRKLSRRDAIKLLGAAAGASVLASLPTKWTKPEITTGVLPAHAQTSACSYAVFIEVLSNDGTLGFSVSQGPSPDQSWSSPGAAGSTAFWHCQSGCLEIDLILNSGISASASVQITTYNHSPFTLNFDNSIIANQYHEILVDMATGDYVLNYAQPPQGFQCLWAG